jgi:putative oxygen-independent coproporphyrinogen III oxidase
MVTEPLALYVHWPFCQSKCPYCDFNSHVSDSIDQARWRDALLSELAHCAAETSGRRLSSVFFGGGTPSLMDPGTVAALIEAARGHWNFGPDVEITLEANPSSAERQKFRALKDAGINRLSLGVQSFDDAALRFLGRRHDAGEARRAIEDANAVFQRTSFDLIYGLPDQDPSGWRAELEQALDLAGEHLSVYQLTIEPGTAFFRDRVAAADDDVAVDLFQITRDFLQENGRPAYEVSNHSRPGAESRHNLTYWRGGDYAGIGPGAHGRLTTREGFTATHQIHDPARWLDAVAKAGHGTAKRRALAPRERAEEMVMTGLRLTEGLDLDRLESLSGLAWDRVLEGPRVEQCLTGGLLERRGTRLLATADGLLRLNAMIAALLAPDLDEG